MAEPPLVILSDRRCAAFGRNRAVRRKEPGCVGERRKWLIENGVAIPRETQITSKQHFGDMQLHLEWSAPTEIRGEGQGRGNSGCYLMGLYASADSGFLREQNLLRRSGCSIYKQTPPLANAMRKPGEWNYYDIIFNAPKFRSNGDVVKPRAM